MAFLLIAKFATKKLLSGLCIQAKVGKGAGGNFLPAAGNHHVGHRNALPALYHAGIGGNRAVLGHAYKIQENYFMKCISSEFSIDFWGKSISGIHALRTWKCNDCSRFKKREAL